MGGIEDDERLERIDFRKIRYICYDLLKDVRFSGEPVVPKITSTEKTVKFKGLVFGVEKLEGMNLSDYLLDGNIPLKDKLEVLLHVTRQLRQIDKAGYVLFDRHGGNIRILRWGESGVSTRQVDIEDMYDKRANRVYSSSGSLDIELIEIFKSKGLDLWVNAVSSISLQGIGVIERSGYGYCVLDLLSKHVWDKTRAPKGSNLVDLEKAIGNAIDILG